MSRAREKCPDDTLLSQLVDRELPSAEMLALERHLAGCARCAVEIATLRAAGAAAALALRGQSHPPAGSASEPDCLSPSQLATLATGELGGEAAARVEAHLQGCDPCVRAAGEAITLLRRVATEQITVPAALRTRVASRWGEATAAGSRSLAEVVVRIARDGLRLLGHELAAPILGIEQVLAAPAGALRGAEAAPALAFVIRAPLAEIHARLLPDGNAVTLTLTLLDLRGQPLGGQRISFRRQRRPIFSARTDPGGEVATPRLEAAVYEVSCPGIATDFRLDLRT